MKKQNPYEDDGARFDRAAEDLAEDEEELYFDEDDEERVNRRLDLIRIVTLCIAIVLLVILIVLMLTRGFSSGTPQVAVAPVAETMEDAPAGAATDGASAQEATPGNAAGASATAAGDAVGATQEGAAAGTSAASPDNGTAASTAARDNAAGTSAAAAGDTAGATQEGAAAGASAAAQAGASAAATPGPAQTPAPAVTPQTIVFQDVNEQVTAKTETNLRDMPSQGTEATVLMTLLNGQVATRTGISDSGWSRIEYEGQTCYAVSSYLTTDLTAPPQIVDDGIRTVFTAVEEQVTPKIRVNLRRLPSVTHPEAQVVATIEAGTVVMRTGVNNDVGWSRVVYEGQTLYCVSSYLQIVP